MLDTNVREVSSPAVDLVINRLKLWKKRGGMRIVMWLTEMWIFFSPVFSV